MNKDMKRKRLLSCLVLYFITASVIHSQNECDRYVLKVDSLIKVDNLDIYGKHKPDSLCENTLFNYTKGKGYLGDSTEFYIRYIFDYLLRKGHSATIRKQAVNELLLRDYAFSVDDLVDIDIRKEDFDEKARKRLATLLRKQYTQEEEELYLKHSSRFITADTTYITQLAYSVNKTYREAKDSITQTLMDGYKKKLYGKGYSIHLPILVGWLNMKDCIPLLDSIQNVDGDVSVMLALARMGNKKYQEYFLNHKENDMNVSFYIGTQDLIAKYGKELYSKETKVYISGSPLPPKPGEFIEIDWDYYNPQVPIAYNVIINLQNGIENFPRLINSNSIITSKSDRDKVPSNIVEKAQQWMKENNGNYIVNPDFLPSIDNYNLDLYRN